MMYFCIFPHLWGLRHDASAFKFRVGPQQFCTQSQLCYCSRNLERRVTLRYCEHLDVDWAREHVGALSSMSRAERRTREKMRQINIERN